MENIVKSNHDHPDVISELQKAFSKSCDGLPLRVGFDHPVASVNKISSSTPNDQKKIIYFGSNFKMTFLNQAGEVKSGEFIGNGLDGATEKFLAFFQEGGSCIMKSRDDEKFEAVITYKFNQWVVDFKKEH